MRYTSDIMNDLGIDTVKYESEQVWVHHYFIVVKGVKYNIQELLDIFKSFEHRRWGHVWNPATRAMLQDLKVIVHSNKGKYPEVNHSIQNADVNYDKFISFLNEELTTLIYKSRLAHIND